MADRTPQAGGRVARRDQQPYRSQQLRRDQQSRRDQQPRRRRIELTFLPGLEDVVRAEVAERIPGADSWKPVPDRADAIWGPLSGPLDPLLGLRTVVAPFLVLAFPVTNPKGLLDGAHFPAIVDAVRECLRLNRSHPPRSFRLDAAGRDSSVLRGFAARVSEAARLPQDPDEGDLVLRLRRTPGGDGWDVLVRLSVRPLSARPWRVEGHPAAANATVAAAMVRLTSPRPTDRVANPMCGSGTILIERLLAASARRAVGVDTSGTAVSAATANAEAAGLTGRVELLTGDIRTDEWLAEGPFDCLYADPPWADKSGRQDHSEDLHLALLRQAHAAAAPRARFAVLTHQIKVMERCLRATRDLWRLESETRVFHKGHNPRIYLLRKVDSAPY